MARMNHTHERADARMAELDKLAGWLDTKFSFMGVRFGLDPILGIVPGVGDAAGLVLSSAILVQAYRIGVRKRTLARMGLNVLGDTLIGSIPVLGTVTDVVWKANRSNVRLVKRDFERARARRQHPAGPMRMAPT